jgi:antitoxin (DNA-binding transcriptional repressor) of toxin-antitoxin stability system
MPKINLRELRDTRQLKAWLRSGKTVELHERNRMIACIVPQPAHPEPKDWPDFGGRVEKLFGNRRLPGADLLIEERGRF